MGNQVNSTEFVTIGPSVFVVVSTFASGRRLLECIETSSRSHHKKGDPIIWYSKEQEAKMKEQTKK